MKIDRIKLNNKVICGIDTVEDRRILEYYGVDVDKLEADTKLKEDINNNNRSYLKYLASTDWYVIRFLETGVEIPQEVLDARADARINIQPQPTE